MGDMLIRNVPDALKREIEAAARRDGQSLSAISIDLLRQSVMGSKKASGTPGVSAWEMLRPILYSGEDDAEAEEFARVMDEVEAERKRDFGRPVPAIE